MCGVILEEAGRTYCDECLREYREEQLAEFARSGPAALAKLRAQGIDPARTPEAKRKMAAANARNMRQVRAWDQEHQRPDPEDSRREILPNLQAIPLSKLAQATGLSIQQCGMVRRGLPSAAPEALGGTSSTRPESRPGRRCINLTGSSFRAAA